MSLLIAFVFIFLSLVLIGLYFISNYRNKNQSSYYWGRAVVLDSMGLFLLGMVFVSNLPLDELPISVRVFGVSSNTLLVGSLLFQTLSIRTLIGDVSKKFDGLIWALTLIFGVLWATFAAKINVNQRIFVFAAIALTIMLLQLVILKKVKRFGLVSRQINFLSYSIWGEAAFTVARIYTISSVGSPIIDAAHLPALGLIVTLMQYGLKIISYAAMLGYWSEKLAVEKAKSDIEAEQFKLLSQRQEQLISDLGRMNKASTTGVLAASIAHELSQPLQSILLNNEYSLKQLHKESPDLDKLKSVLNEQEFNAKRMSQVMTTLRGLFTDSDSTENSFDLCTLTKNLDLLIQPEAKNHSIEVDFEGETSLMVNANSNEIQQVILNLVSNAIQALSENKTSNPRIVIKFEKATDWALCHVEDNGPGLSEDKIENLFKFLNTTKSTGMGLGLWISKYIIVRNRGEISAGKSELGGAKFTIKLHSAY